MLRDKYHFDDVKIPSSELLCHPSRITNTYELGIERIIQDEDYIPGCDIQVCIEHHTTPPFIEQRNVGLRRKLTYFIATSTHDKKINLGEKLIYDARHIDNRNMAHLIHGHFSMLGFLSAKYGYGKNDIIILLDRYPPKLAVEAFNVIGYEVIATDNVVSGNIISINGGDVFNFLPYVNSLDINFLTNALPEKIFISRKNTRKLENECEIDSLLKNEGFEKFYFEDTPIIEQWSIMRNITDVVAIHGAALGCLAFNNPTNNFKLVELFGSGFVVNPFRKYMAMLLGKWIGCRGKITPEVVRDIDLLGMSKKHAFDDFELAPEVLELALSRIKLLA